MTSLYPVLIIEDRAQIAERLIENVAQSEGLKVVGSATMLKQGLRLLHDLKPRVVLVDLGLPDGSGIEIIKAIAQVDWKCDALVISIFGDEGWVIEAIQAGAKGYILKSGGLDHNGKNILSIIDGGSPISPSIARHLLRLVNNQAESNLLGGFELTNREVQILRSVSQGYKRKEIGNQLDISTGTVSNHINSIYRKLNISSNIQAVMQATKMGLL